MGHCHTWVNLVSPKVLKTIIVEIQRQLARIEVIQSLNVIITTTWMEMMVAPIMNVVRGGSLIRYVTNLVNG
jgi:hypothetical protein